MVKFLSEFLDYFLQSVNFLVSITSLSSSVHLTSYRMQKKIFVCKIVFNFDLVYVFSYL